MELIILVTFIFNAGLFWGLLKAVILCFVFVFVFVVVCIVATIFDFISHSGECRGKLGRVEMVTLGGLDDHYVSRNDSYT